MFSYHGESRQRPLCTCHILTKNDANTILDSLDSVITPMKNWLFDKILVLIDTKSEDATGRIIHAYAGRYPNVEIVPYKWSDPPNFAAARNYAIANTRTPYAFWLDGDEKLTKPEQIRSMLSRAQGQAFQMWVISPVGNNRFHNMYQSRLFPVLPGVKFECPVFEMIDWSLKRNGIQREGTKDDPIFHPGYIDPKTLKRKNERNLRIMRKYLREHRTDDPQRRHILTQYQKLTAAK